jgi:hypothetical protein
MLPNSHPKSSGQMGLAGLKGSGDDNINAEESVIACLIAYRPAFEKKVGRPGEGQQNRQVGVAVLFVLERSESGSG